MIKRVMIGLAIVLAGALAVAIARFNMAGDPGEPLSGQTRADFVRSAVGGCVAQQKASPDNAELQPAVIDAYCSCYAEALATRLTGRDIETLTGQKPQEMQSTVRPKMDDAEGVCLAKLDDGK